MKILMRTVCGGTPAILALLQSYVACVMCCDAHTQMFIFVKTDAVKKHKKFFGDDDDGEKADDKGLGAAAAMQALKMFSSGETGGQKQSQGGFMGLAMAEASRVSLFLLHATLETGWLTRECVLQLFDQRQSQGKVAEGTSKESAIQQAGEMALKMYFKSQGEQKGGFMGLASRFLTK